MTHRVGPKGQVVIPKDLRDELSLEAGDEVDFELVNGGVVVTPTRRHETLKGSMEGSGLVSALEADRRAEPR
ncbi:MAG: AbrB/MazE/SpoVT family DNA-binding domain-containing protein [Acidimicrobiia bacterium]|nr:AbrB/MazE/SpoVT family DNA-binding domain-containing protein [Acidimicrobiia bacterium]